MLAIPAINVSADTYNYQFCSPLYGQYIDSSKADRPCKPCPVDFYCDPIYRKDGNGQTLLDPQYKIPKLFSAEKPGVDGEVNSEVKPCPSGTTTIGNTLYIPGNGTITKIVADFNLDTNYPVRNGELATSISNCKTPYFECPTTTPATKFENGITKCVADCGDQTMSTNNGVKVCQVPSKECPNGQISYNKQCYTPCPDGSIAFNNGVQKPCVTISSSSSTSTSSSAVPPVIPIPEVIACTITGQVRSYGTCACPLPNYAVQDSNGYKSCTTCPSGNTITQVGIETTGEIVYKCEAPSQGGGSSIWTWLGIAAGAYLLVDGFSCGGLFNFGSCGSPSPVQTETVIDYTNYKGIETLNCPNGKYSTTDYSGTNCTCPFGTIEPDCSTPNTTPIIIDVPTPTIKCKDNEFPLYNENGVLYCAPFTKNIGGDCGSDCGGLNQSPFNLSLNPSVDNTYNNYDLYAGNNLSMIGYSNEPIIDTIQPNNGTYFSNINNQYSVNTDNVLQDNSFGYIWNI
jgi:hypothetical protein